jgi:hypothetical protein
VGPSRPAGHRRRPTARAASRRSRPLPRAAPARRPLACQREKGRRHASRRAPAGGGVGAHRPEPDARGAQAEGAQADRDPSHRPGPGRAASAPPAHQRPTALRNARVRARLLGTTAGRSPRADLGRRRRAHHRRHGRQLDGPVERDQDGRRTNRTAALTARPGPRRVAARPGLPRTRHDCVPWRFAGRHPHRGPVEPVDPGHVQSGQARGGTAERARIRPAALVRFAPDPRRPVDPRGGAAGGPLAADMPARLRAPVRRVRSRHKGTSGGGHQGRPCKLVPLSYLPADRNRRKAARSAEIPTAGSPRAGTSATRPPRTAARFRPGTSGAARARCRVPFRPGRARTGSTCRA